MKKENVCRWGQSLLPSCTGPALGLRGSQTDRPSTALWVVLCTFSVTSQLFCGNNPHPVWGPFKLL